MATKVKKKKAKKLPKNDFLKMTHFIKFPWFLIILASISAVVGSVVTGKVPDVTSTLFDGNFEVSKLWSVLGTLLLSVAISLIAYTFRVYAESKSTLITRNRIWERIMNSKTSYFEFTDPTSTLNFVTVDAQTVGAGMTELFIYIPQMATLLIVAIAQVFSYSTKFIPAILLMLPMHVVYFFIMAKWQTRVSKEIEIETGLLTAYLAERIKNLPLIKAFCTQPVESVNGKIAAEKLYKLNIQYYELTVVNAVYQVMTPIVGTVIAVIYGGSLLKAGEITVPNFVALITYMASINSVIMVVAIVYVFVKAFHGTTYRLARLFESEPEEIDEKVGETNVQNGDIAFKDITFGYGKKENVIENVSFSVPQGKITALVGPSGSGKTTLIKLLERLYAPKSGEITIGGRNIDEYNVQSFRRKIAYVIQDAGIFSGKIRESFCYGVERVVSDEELRNVAEKVGLLEYIDSLPNGFDTELAYWGSSLSGGQRQRIVIARALLRTDSDVFIFDEPTSALDPETANDITKLIFEDFENKTIIIISHELRFIAKSDNIVVIKKGELLGEGEHEKLMATCDVYCDLVEEQSYKEVFGK